MIATIVNLLWSVSRTIVVRNYLIYYVYYIDIYSNYYVYYIDIYSNYYVYYIDIYSNYYVFCYSFLMLSKMLFIRKWSLINIDYFKLFLWPLIFFFYLYIVKLNRAIKLEDCSYLFYHGEIF